ncbi:MAG: zinc ribbon domain-containing protein [Candidatus Brocadiae bacterium]|nr:zinc ribbon domain-containing protein [Candidatus Brocadiia bacterium]
MPTYEYQCKHCKHKFEAFQSIMADPLSRCPECGRNGLRRLIGTGAGIIFKGSGFYATDYRRGSSSNSKSGDSESKSSDSKSDGDSSSS